jgi:hypothetical protein
MAESEIVTVIVTLTRDEYAAALRALAQSRSRPQRILFWVSVAILGYFCYSWLRLPDRSVWGGILGLAGLAIFVLLVTYGVPFLSARSFVKKNADKLGPATHSIGPDGTSNESSHGESKAKWIAYLRIRETPKVRRLHQRARLAPGTVGHRRLFSEWLHV